MTSGDLAIAGTIWELGRAAVVAINKWDLLDDEGREKLEQSFERLDELLANPGRVNVSALSGRGMDKLWGPIDKALAAYHLKLSHGPAQPPVRGVRQEGGAALAPAARPGSSTTSPRCRRRRPPSCCSPTARSPRTSHYRRYLENRLREELDLPGVPVRLVVRKRTE